MSYREKTVIPASPIERCGLCCAVNVTLFTFDDCTEGYSQERLCRECLVDAIADIDRAEGGTP